MAHSKIWLLGDPHLKHLPVAKSRGFDTTEEHDFALRENVRELVNPRKDTLIILGDVSFGIKDCVYIDDHLRCDTVRCVMGNHDTDSYLPDHWRLYGSYGHGSVLYTHIPVSLEMLSMDRWEYNIHAHTHGYQMSEGPYLSLSLESTDMKPVLLSEAVPFLKTIRSGNIKI